MQIKVNERTMDLFSGATVADALRKYSRDEWKLVQKNRKKVCDQHGHELALNGELSEGQVLFLKQDDETGSPA